MPEANALYRLIPSMNAVLEALSDTGARNDSPLAVACKTLLVEVPRPCLRESIEKFLDTCRIAIRNGQIKENNALLLPVLLPSLVEHINRRARPLLRRVLNATGIIIHTNLGRSCLAEEAVAAVSQTALHTSNLEFDLEEGARGDRHKHVEALICRLTGAQAAIAINNNTAAVLLALDTLCKDREVIVSRGELVEIGGNFRIPDIIKKSGSLLLEVGTTNCTHLYDFEAALSDRTAAFLKVHTSNFRISGFTQAVDRTELARLAHASGIPLIEDLGSGILLDLASLGFTHLADEPTVAKALAQGADLVTFSGDKALGGPQAGIIAGKAEYIKRIAKNPLLRALRIDKLSLAALEGTLRLYLDPPAALKHIPTLRMLTITKGEMLTRSRKFARLLKKSLAEQKDLWIITTHSGISRAGGGAFPEIALPTWMTLVQGRHSIFNPNQLQKTLLGGELPLLARVEDNALCLDCRTLEDAELPLAADILAQTLKKLPGIA